jgi:hypothetical protein
MSRCVDPPLGVKVLSYDLLEGDEKEEVDAHLQVCTACRDLVEQTFGDEGALRELDWRAFRLSQRQRVQPHAWITRRLMDLWIPFFLVAAGVGALWYYLATRPPDPERVGLTRLAALRTGVLDSLSSQPMPQISPAPTSLLVQPDQDAIVLVYEAADDYMRRLIPGGDALIPILEASRPHELALPELESLSARIVLVLAPAASSRNLEEWDRAVMERLGGQSDETTEQRGWPDGVTPTLRWLR